MATKIAAMSSSMHRPCVKTNWIVPKITTDSLVLLTAYLLLGDWHRQETLGPERAKHISPTGSALAKGMIFTQHHDAPVIPPRSMMVPDATVNRTTCTGVVLGEDQRVSPYI